MVNTEIEKIVVFGAGYYGRLIVELVTENFSSEIVAVIDNKYYGKCINQFEVKKADNYLNNNLEDDIYFIIAGKYCHEMFEQLIRYKVNSERIYSLESYILSHFQIDYSKSKLDTGSCMDRIVVFDCSSGFGLGGVENWTYRIAGELKNRNFDISLYTNNMDIPPRIDFKCDVNYVEYENNYYNDLITTVEALIKFIEKYNKVCFVLAHMNVFTCAVLLLKKRFSNRVSVISVIHSSLYNVMQENIMIEEFVDYFLCVNPYIKKIMSNRLRISEQSVFCETPIDMKKLEHTYSINEKQPIRIGYAARLEVEHKRSDLIIQLIEELEKRECNYLLNIAGVGNCYSLIDNYIKEKKIENKVVMLGEISYKDMYNFWNKQDIAINLSETEGCSLSMLESMMCGCVEVITETLGVDWLVKEGETGFLVPIGDVICMAKKIEYLSKNRELISVLGKNAHIMISERCNIKRYVDFFEKLI